MKLLRNKFLWTAIFYLWVVMILVFTSISFSPKVKELNEGGFRFDYLEHFILYAIIPVLYFLAKGAYMNLLIKDSYYLILLGIIFSMLTEMQQYYIPGRSFNPIDLSLNLAGFTIGLLAVKYLLSNRSSLSEERK